MQLMLARGNNLVPYTDIVLKHQFIFVNYFIKSFLNSTLSCYDNYLFEVMLEGAVKQCGWGVHERVMENDINVLLKLLPPEKSITFSTASSQTHTHTVR